jgi:hypothetical protein
VRVGKARAGSGGALRSPGAAVRALIVIGLLLAAVAPASATGASKKPGDKLYPGSALASGSWLESPNGAYRLMMQPDGNLVLSGGGVVIWETNTGLHPGAYALMQRDGNVVVYQEHVPLWDSGTEGLGNIDSSLVVKNDGHLYIYSHTNLQLWRTFTLAPPAPLSPFSSPAVAGEGVWQPAGRLSGGQVGIYETLLRPPGSKLAAGVAWMDTQVLRAALYSGTLSPGDGPWKLTAPIAPTAARSLVAAFNGGFKFPASGGGYYAEGRTAHPLVAGGASLVIYSNGDATVGQWGRDVTMTNRVVAVRQNLSLLVDNGRAVAGLNPYDAAIWGATWHGIPNVWRSGIGVTADGALVYVTGPSLQITQLAALLVRAGCVRAMTLDINPDWTVFATYDPSTPNGLAGASNGQNLVAGTVQGPFTFFESWWARDFITMSAR